MGCDAHSDVSRCSTRFLRRIDADPEVAFANAVDGAVFLGGG